MISMVGVVKKNFLRWAVALLNGALLSLAYPGQNWGVLAWVALMPLLGMLWKLESRKLKRKAFLLGYLFGIGLFASMLAWLQTVSWLGVVVLSGYLAFYPAVWAMFVARYWNPWLIAEPQGTLARSARSLGYAMLVAGLWSGFEVLRAYAFTGFSWNGLGVAMHEQLVMMQMADIFGVAGISFLMVFVQVVILQVMMRMWRRAQSGQARWGAHPDFGVAAILICAAFLYGVVKMRQVGAMEKFPLRVLLVQVNVPQMAAQQLMSAEEIHFAYGEQVEIAMNELAEKHRQILEQAQENEVSLFYPDWLVLPEVALNGRLISTASGENAMWTENEQTIEWFRESGCETVLLGLSELEGQREGDYLTIVENPRAWNSLVMVNKQNVESVYRKRHLVMFGEYIPFLETLPWLKSIYEKQAGAEYNGSYSAGDQSDPLKVEVRGQKFSLIPSICFEDTVAHEARRFIRDEMQMMINVTNDGWFGRSTAAAQHFANAKFRAVELRRPMLRCANMGVSGVVSVTGASQTLLDKNGSPFLRGHLFAQVDVPVKPMFSLYQKWGDGPMMILGVICLFLTLLRARKSS